jgi:hypothetical protein
VDESFHTDGLDCVWNKEVMNCSGGSASKPVQFVKHNLNGQYIYLNNYNDILIFTGIFKTIDSIDKEEVNLKFIGKRGLIRIAGYPNGMHPFVFFKNITLKGGSRE